MKKFAILIAALLTAGCFSSTPNSRFYLLESAKTAQPLSMRKINIAVQDIAIPQYLDRPQIVLQRQDDPELKVSEFDRWASDLNTMLQNLVINDLQNNLPNATIKRLAYGGSPRYVVKINIEKFGGWPGETAYIKGNWQILNPRGKILAGENINLKRRCGENYAAFVRTLSLMWSDTAQTIAAQIIKLPAA